MEKTPEKYICNDCNFKCNKNSEWVRHISTRKHLFRIILNEKNADEITLYKCKNCNKSYKAKNSLWYHEKKCIVENCIKEDDNIKPEDLLNSDNTINASLLMEIVKQTQEFKNLLIEQNKQMQEQNKQIQEQCKQNTELVNKFVEKDFVTNNNTTNNNSNNTTNNNQKFNLNFFLNETCKAGNLRFPCHPSLFFHKNFINNI